MKKILILILSLIVFGCSSSDEDTKISEKITIPTVSLERNPQTVGPGETCGGVEKKICESNYLCEFIENSSDASGICVDPIFDKTAKCSDEQNPVCGIKSGQFNAYQNECQLNRYGAEFVKKGFCLVDETVKNNCKAISNGIGNCFNSFSGYEFDGKKCQLKNVNGCESQIPFKTQKDCESTCM